PFDRLGSQLTRLCEIVAVGRVAEVHFTHPDWTTPTIASAQFVAAPIPFGQPPRVRRDPSRHTTRLGELSHHLEPRHVSGSPHVIVIADEVLGQMLPVAWRVVAVPAGE